MQHTESSIQIYFSSDHSRFKMITGNRQLNDTKIKRIIKDIEAGIDVLKYYPIQVVEKDGRLEIPGLPVSKSFTERVAESPY